MKYRSCLLANIATFLALNGCSTTFNPRPCSSDLECGSGLVCNAESATATSYCTKANDAPVRLGMSAAISGINAALGIEMRAGIELAFSDNLAKGGINGRPIKVAFLDDGYDPATAEAAAKTLTDAQPGTGQVRCPVTTLTSQDATPTPISVTALDRGPNAVLALIGNVGTPTMVRAAPVALETQTLYFGAFTGAGAILRDGRAGDACSRYIFNVRASYAQEARAAMEYFIKNGVRDSKHVISFDQNDTFGDAGYKGITNAYIALSAEPANGLSPLAADEKLARYRYTRGDVGSVAPVAVQVTQYLTTLLTGNTDNHIVAIMMTDTYGPATAFIRDVRNWQYKEDAEQTSLKKATRLTLIFNNVSFVGPNALAAYLKDASATNNPPKPYSDNVFVTQVVPNYLSDQSAVTQEYRALLQAANRAPTFTSFEGYIAGRIFAAGLQQHVTFGKGAFTPEAIIAALEAMPDLTLGLGGAARFSNTNHNYLKSIWVTGISADAGFINRYYWTDKGVSTITIEEF